jgi:hypothetical protein
MVMKKYVLNILVWIVSITVGLFIYNKTGLLYEMLKTVWMINFLFWIVYYLSCLKIGSKLPSNIEITKEDVASGRCFGIFINMFLVQYSFGTYDNLARMLRDNP